MSAPAIPTKPAALQTNLAWLGLLCGLIAAVLFAGKAVLVRIAYAHGADPTALLGLRMALSLPCFAVLAWWFARGTAPLALRDRVALLGLGVLGYHVASWLDFAGLRHIDAALERVVLFLYPTITALWAIWLGRERARVALFVGLACTYVGILLTWGDRIVVTGAARTGLGVALVAAAALVFAIYLLAAEGIFRRVGGLRATAVAMLGACMTTVIHALIATPTALLHPTPIIFWLGAALALLATVIPVLLAGVALQHLGAARSALLGTVAPAITALLGWVFAGEFLGLLGWTGIAITMAGAWLATRR